ncbi:sacsin N-terminal ATP-binding-like domain-containing protein [Rhizobium arsenicireducens]
MKVDYGALREENRLEYGRAIGRIGKRLLEDRYDKRTHFIYEVIQNAEDALRRRSGWSGSRTITFSLTSTELTISHFGSPFDHNDVKGICGIDESTKGVNSIGRFGIGFKSVYAFTWKPEVYSGSEAFSIVDYVLPYALPARDRAADETVIVLPLKSEEPSAFKEIAEGLLSLGGEALLFLKQVEQIAWSIEGEGSGSYRRLSSASGFMREVALETTRGIETDRADYLLFSRDVEHNGAVVGQAELAFNLVLEEGERLIRPMPDARLVVFFPTVLPTYTGFLVQGPYQTTPSRDNIPADEPWNVKLASLTADLVVDALCHLRDTGLLNVAALRTLPIERSKFDGLFAPLYERTAEAFRNQKLLPTSSGRFASAGELRLARSQDVRDLLGPRHLGALLGVDGNVYWTGPEITVDRAPQIRSYLNQDLKISELSLEQVLGRMTDEFLAEQSDTWMIKLYRLLEAQPALLRSSRIQQMALFRLEDGTHVPLMRHGMRQVFLPIGEKTGFPTLRASLVNAQTRRFLALANLTEPDPVDDVIHNLLPSYKQIKVATGNYAEDIARMVRAFQTDSQTQREKLVAALRSANIVMVRDAADNAGYISVPGNVYLATARLLGLFADVPGVFLVDNAYDCLRGEPVREMLEAAGAVRVLRTVSATADLSEAVRQDVRKAAGWEGASSEQPIADLDIAGLDGLLKLLPTLSPDQRSLRSRLLWEALSELIDRRPNVLSVTYNWTYMAARSAQVDAKFVRRLKSTPWIPDATGQLLRPNEVLFEELDWPSHPLLESRVVFKAPAIAMLAREVGLDARFLDELKRRGLTSVEQLNQLLGPADDLDQKTEVGKDEYEERGGKN